MNYIIILFVIAVIIVLIRKNANQKSLDEMSDKEVLELYSNTKESFMSTPSLSSYKMIAILDELKKRGLK